MNCHIALLKKHTFLLKIFLTPSQNNFLNKTKPDSYVTYSLIYVCSLEKSIVKRQLQL